MRWLCGVSEKRSSASSFSVARGESLAWCAAPYRRMWTAEAVIVMGGAATPEGVFAALTSRA
eukprot:scaffold48873_cov309-Isochrysis_galbana.AAC.4